MSTKDVVKQFSLKLCEQLPLENDIFFAMAEQASMFPLNTGNSIKAKLTRAKKVSCLLEHVAKPGATEYLPKLLNVMRKCEFVNVVVLADEIQAAAKIGMYIYVCKPLMLNCSYVRKCYYGHKNLQRFYVLMCDQWHSQGGAHWGTCPTKLALCPTRVFLVRV